MRSPRPVNVGVRPDVPMEIQRADPRFRRLAGLSCVALVVVGAIALWAVQSWLAGLAQAAPSAARHQLLAAFASVIGASCAMLLALGIYLWRKGGQVRGAAQFPPPGMHMLRDTPVLRGAAAYRRARIMQGIGVALVLCCLALLAATWRLYSVLADHAV